jgi:branched-chain amino acid aminotransferase/4-amino-4-deoxychorismate lyase
MALRPVEEIAAGLEALARAEAIFLTNSLIGARPVSRLGDRTFEAHPMAETLRASLA